MHVSVCIEFPTLKWFYAFVLSALCGHGSHPHCTGWGHAIVPLGPGGPSAESEPQQPVGGGWRPGARALAPGSQWQWDPQAPALQQQLHVHCLWGNRTNVHSEAHQAIRITEHMLLLSSWATFLSVKWTSTTPLNKFLVNLRVKGEYPMRMRFFPFSLQRSGNYKTGWMKWDVNSKNHVLILVSF